MNRSRITRRTPLRPTGPPKRRKPMKRVSSKTAKRRRQAKGPREQYVASVLTCQCCFRRKASECHECHANEVSDYSRWPITRQLALKLVGDPDNFSLQFVNDLRGRDANAITLADVARHLEVSP